MKRICFILVCTLSVLLVSCGSKKNANGWFSDFEAAKHVAKSKGKNIVLFVNSIYDTKGTEDGVSLLLDTPEFTKSVSEDFVCVHFDFSKIPEIMGQDPTSLTGGEQKSLEKKQSALLEQMKFADLYGIRETPALLIISKDGFYIASVNFDYLESAVSSYKSAVYMEIGTVQDFEGRLRAARKGELVSRMNAYNQILDETEEYRRPIFYELWKEAAALDKKDESGLLGKFMTECAHVEATNLINEKKFEEASAVYEKYASDERMSAEEKQVLYFFATQPYSSSNLIKYDEVLRLLELSYAAAPESEYASSIKTALDEVRMYAAEAEEQNSQEMFDEK